MTYFSKLCSYFKFLKKGMAADTTTVVNVQVLPELS